MTATKPMTPDDFDRELDDYNFACGNQAITKSETHHHIAFVKHNEICNAYATLYAHNIELQASLDDQRIQELELCVEALIKALQDALEEK